MGQARQRIVPHMWYDKEAVAAAELYTSVLPDSAITQVTRLKDTPSGDCDQVWFKLWGQEMMAISAGPHFKLNPAISFILNFDPSREKDAEALLDETWNRMADGAAVLMPLGAYPFSKHYGWLQDRYGLSWQLMLTNPEGEERPAILPMLLFVGENCGKTEEAIAFYLSVFADSRQGEMRRYPAGLEHDREGTVMFADFMLENTWFAAMDSGYSHQFQFNEALSFLVHCDSQEQVDAYWEKLSAVPEAEQCGWLKDKYGVSWQIVPAELGEMLSKGTPEQVARVTQAFMGMKKLVLADLQKAYRGE